jgi:DNA-binding transcriptional LysR family regulator
MSLDHTAKRTLARKPNINENLARAEHEHGICFYGNHALCIHRRQYGLTGAQDRCPPPKHAHVERCTEWLARGEWKDGSGSYGLKHQVEESTPEPLYVSNGALCLAAARMGLGVAWTFPDLYQPSPNARIYKMGHVPAAKRGAKKKSKSND